MAKLNTIFVALLVTIGILCPSLLLFSDTAAASSPFIVNCPGASDNNGVNDDNAWRGQWRSTSWDFNNPGTDYSNLYHPTDPAWSAVGFFNDSLQWEGWPAQNLPPDNATILYVYALVRVALDGSASDSRGLIISYATNETSEAVRTETATFHSVGAPTIWGGDPGWLTITCNITAYEGWTPAMLRSNETWVCVLIPDASTPYFYIEYAGLYYAWYYPEAPPSGGDDEGIWELGSGSMLIFAMGTIGFCGMIGVSPFAVWLWRREGGDKIHAFVMMVATFTVCFALFLASLG